jgi:hypothetical protein
LLVKDAQLEDARVRSEFKGFVEAMNDKMKGLEDKVNGLLARNTANMDLLMENGNIG